MSLLYKESLQINKENTTKSIGKCTMDVKSLQKKYKWVLTYEKMLNVAINKRNVI